MKNSRTITPPPSVDASTVGVVVRLSKVLEIVLSARGLTMNQFHLMSLVDEGETAPTMLSRRLVMKPPNITAMVTGLIERGLMTSSKSAEDKRRTELAVTDDGRTSLHQARHRCAQALEYLAEEATAGGGRPLIDSLASWLPALDMELMALRRQTGEEPDS
jgi:DNA-binding MarR family transcriptional regulator